MSFSSSFPKFVSLGNKRATYGTYANTSGSTGGDINTGLNTVEYFSSNNYSQAATTNAVSISGGIVALTTVANEGGQWFAIGE